ncbi:MAG: 4Fe-4S dicluster domain-containing protein [Cryobacterium sp.]|nr:4Fe-4S dicluster domain-containing protein [Oligoflexia bacterium]
MSENLNSGLEDNAAFIPPRHWLGAEELSPTYWNDPKIKERRAQEFYDKPVETIDLIDKIDTKGIKRRDFLTLMGASMAMASFACARRPVHKIIPYVVKPEEITGGIANYYATVCPETGYGLLAKVREGRPIKLEGNPDHPMNRGALSARGQAHVLDLYDMDRAKEPMKVSRGKGSKAMKWEDADAEISAKLKQVAAGSGRIRVLSGRILGDTTEKLMGEFVGAFAAGAHIQFDDAVMDDLATGQAESYGTAVIPHYRFDLAETVLSLGADFLGTWGPSEEFSADWVKNRIPDPKNPKEAKLSKLFVVETMMSVTGANADERFPVRPDGVLKVAAAIAGEVARKKGISVPSQLAGYSLATVANDTGVSAKKITEISDALVASGSGKSLIVAGGLSSKTENAVGLQVIANFLNSTLGNDGSTVDGNGRASTKVGSRTSELSKLTMDMNRGAVDALIISNANPLFSIPRSLGFALAMAKVPLVIVIGDREDETVKFSDYLLPDHHFLENWGDAQPRGGVVALQQPTLAPIHSSRALGDTLLTWIKSADLKAKGLAGTVARAEEGKNTWHDYLKANWKETYAKGASFEGFWENSLRDGVLKNTATKSGSSRAFRSGSFTQVPSFRPASTGFSLALYSKVAIGDGNRANNPWLQEMPDPVTTSTWDNYLNMSPKAAEKLSIKQDDVVEFTSGPVSMDLPVNIQPGLHEGVVAAAIGYGREAAGKVGNGVGRDVKIFVDTATMAYSGAAVTVKKTGRRYQLAITQWHNSSEDRPIVNDITLAEFKANPKTANHTDPHLRMEEVPTMWEKHKYPGYRWGMTIDLNACTGCGSCIIGCQAENNIPVVGRDNVRKSREMHWIRIDRYYSGSPENPDVIFQPMLCQHCENAPCETVCPVLATVHDDEGMNSQIYNRCVGTRYCQNNCPYKVRRFNFFDHWKSYEGTMNLAWNPDVTVRTRGIMEKCTFCVQRIRDVKDKAKDEGRKVREVELKTACQQTCPTDAITFGDINNPENTVTKLRKDARAFRVLEVLNTVPAISYLSKVRNKEGEKHHGGEAAANGGEHHG